MRSTAAEGDPADPRAFRSALGRFASGLTVVTCRDGERLHGMTCQSFASVSLDPPLVSVCLRSGSPSLSAVERAGSFCVNVLAEDQQWLSDRFGRPHPDRWNGLAWSANPSGHPVLPGCLLSLDCTLSARVGAGDHVILLGGVDRLRPGDPAGRPLLYFGGGYGGLLPVRRRSPPEARPRRTLGSAPSPGYLGVPGRLPGVTTIRSRTPEPVLDRGPAPQPRGRNRREWTCW